MPARDQRLGVVVSLLRGVAQLLGRIAVHQYFARSNTHPAPFNLGEDQIGAGMETDALKTIPQFEQVRHDDQFELTPQQKLAAAKMGGAPEKTTADYVTALLGDVLTAI